MPARSRAWLAVAIATVVAAPFFLVALGAATFDDPGEGMHAEIARELLVSRDPSVLTLDGVRYIDKPPLLYGLMAATLAVGGLSETSARLVPALAALATVAATAWLGARLLGAWPGVVAGLALASSVLFFAFGRYVRPETLFAAAITWGLALVVVGVTEQRRSTIALGFVVFGLAGLAKDPLGALAPPLAVLAAFAIARRTRRDWPGVAWPAVALWLLLGLGWWFVVEARTPGTLWYTFVDNKILNAAGMRRFPDEDVPLTALEFVAVALLGAAPWSLAGLVSIGRLARRTRRRDPRELPWITLAAWVVGLVALTLASRFRLPHYGIPMYGALALLAARAWCDTALGALVVTHAIGFAALGVGALLLWQSDGRAFVDLVVSNTDVATRKTTVAGQPPPFPPWESIRPLLGHVGVVLVVGALLVLAALLLPARWRRAGAVTAVLATMLAVLPAAASALSLVSSYRAVRDLARTVAHDAAPADVIAHEGPIEASGAFEWYSGRRPVIVDGTKSVLAFGATRPESRSIVWDEARLRDAWHGPRRVWLVSMRAPDVSIARSLPDACLVLATPTRWLYTNRRTPPCR